MNYHFDCVRMSPQVNIIAFESFDSMTFLMLGEEDHSLEIRHFTNIFLLSTSREALAQQASAIQTCHGQAILNNSKFFSKFIYPHVRLPHVRD